MRLLYVIAYTSEMEPMKHFYRDRVGLRVGYETPFWTQFDTESGSLALLAVHPGQNREIELCFEATDIESQVRALRERGVEFIDEIREQPFGRIIHLRDPEGNLLSLLQPAGWAAETAGAAGVGSPGGVSATDGESAAVATSVAVGTATSAPRLSTAIINARDMAVMRTFYRDRLGLHATTESTWWVAFDAGRTGLALHPRVDRPQSERHHGQAVSFGFAADDLIEWSDRARERGLHFTTAPIDEGLGLFADAVDPDGNEITFREPPAPASIEEELAEAFEDDGVPQHTAIRKPVKKGAKAMSRLAVKPEYRPSAAARKTAATGRATASRKSVRASSTRGAGPAGSRLKPKRVADPKRARNRPATGRLKKAERTILARKKRAVARASKSKPVKREVAGRSKGRRR